MKFVELKEPHKIQITNPYAGTPWNEMLKEIEKATKEITATKEDSDGA